MSAYFLKLYFKSPVRIGMPGRDEQATRESLPADQVFSWLSLGWIRAFGLEDFLHAVVEPFVSGDRPWEHSDLFPDTEQGVWLPAPRWPTSESKGQSPAPDKKLRTPWVRWDAFFSTLKSGAAATEGDYGKPMEVNMLNNVKVRMAEGKDNDPFYTACVQKRSTPSADKKSDQDSRTTFTGLVRCKDPSILKKLEAVLRLLADEGFGGNRSSGLGAIDRFSVTEARDAEKNLISNGHASRYVILSPCYPTPRMLESVSSSDEGSNCYALVSRGGWIYDSSGRATDIRKLTTYLFDSGSCFSIKPEGQLVDVGRHGKTSYRYGIPFVVEA